MHGTSGTRPREGIQRVLASLSEWGKGCPLHRLPASAGSVAALGTTSHFTRLAHTTPARRHRAQALATVGREKHLGSGC